MIDGHLLWFWVAKFIRMVGFIVWSDLDALVRKIVCGSSATPFQDFIHFFILSIWFHLLVLGAPKFSLYGCMKNTCGIKQKRKKNMRLPIFRVLSLLHFEKFENKKRPLFVILNFGIICVPLHSPEFQNLFSVFFSWIWYPNPLTTSRTGFCHFLWFSQLLIVYCI